MPKWDLDQITSKATQAIGRRADIPRSEASFWANAAYAFVAERAPHALQEQVATSSTTSGENRVDLPPDFNELETLSFLTDVGSSRTLRQTSPDKVDATGFDDPGKPDEFVLYSDWLELFPSPDSAYSLQLRYKSHNTDLVNGSDVPSVATPWRRAVYDKTKELLLSEVVNDPAAAAAQRNEFLDTIQSLRDDHAKRQAASREDFHVTPYTYAPD